MDKRTEFMKMVDDIKNDKHRLESDSEGYSSMEIPEPKVNNEEP